MERDRLSSPLTLALCGGYVLILLDVTVVNVALPSIGAGLHATAAGLAWVVVAGFLGFGTASVWCALASGAPVARAATSST